MGMIPEKVMNPLTATTKERFLRQRPHTKKPGNSSVRIRNADAVILVKEINMSKNGNCHMISRRCI